MLGTAFCFFNQPLKMYLNLDLDLSVNISAIGLSCQPKCSYRCIPTCK